MTFGDILDRLAQDVFPSAIQLGLVLIAAFGLYVVTRAIYDTYKLAIDGHTSGRGGSQGSTSGGGIFLQLIIGGLLVVPSVTLWRMGNIFFEDTSITSDELLSYVSGGSVSNACERFSWVMTLGFMLAGIIAIFIAGVRALDQERGINPTGYRSALFYLLGGLGCIFINDIITILGNTINIDMGFQEICSSIG